MGWLIYLEGKRSAQPSARHGHLEAFLRESPLYGIMAVMFGLRRLLPRSGSNVSTRDESTAAPHGVLDTLQMLRYMGYRDVWVKNSEVTSQVIAQARTQGWSIADVADDRVKFTLRWTDGSGASGSYARTPSEAEGGPERYISMGRGAPSPTPSQRSMGSFHTVGGPTSDRSGSLSSQSTGHTRSDSGSSGAVSPPLPAPASRSRRRGSGRQNQTMGGFRLDEMQSPKSQASALPSPTNLPSPGGLSPSLGLQQRSLVTQRTPELRLTTPEGVQSPPARPESGALPDGDYFSYMPHPATLSVVSEAEEAELIGEEEAMVERTRPLIIRRAQSSSAFSLDNLDHLDDLVPTLDRTQTRRDMMELGSPTSIRVSLESLYSQDDDEPPFAWEPPTPLRDRSHSPTRMPSPEFAAAISQRVSELSLSGSEGRSSVPKRPTYSRSTSSNEPPLRTDRTQSDATVRPKPSPPDGRGSL